MTAPTMPGRRWPSDQPPEIPRATILVSSRDGAAVPTVDMAQRFVAKLNARAGMHVRMQYAKASVPKWRNVKAHMLETVAVVFRDRDWEVYGWAVWHRRDGGAWRFDSAQYAETEGGTGGLRSLGYRELVEAVSL